MRVDDAVTVVETTSVVANGAYVQMRHHDALQLLRLGCSAITLSHWSSERPTSPRA